MKDHVWVIIPVYNAEKYLAATVESVLHVRNAYEGDISLILINDGSVDSSGRICDQMRDTYDGITVIHQANRGVSCARNTGIEHVLQSNRQGYIAFLDADDMWAPDVRLKGLDGNTDLVAYSTALSNEEGTRYRIANQFKDGIMELERANVKWINDGTFAAFFYRIDLIRNYRLRFMEGIKGNEDVIFWRQATFCARTVLFHKDILYIYRMNHSSVTHRTRTSKENALHIPRAWNMAKEWVYSLESYTEDEKRRWIENCEDSVGARLLESVRLLAEQRYRTDEITRIVEESMLSDSLERLREEKLAGWQQKDLRLWRKSVHAFVWKHRMRGIALSFAKRMMGFNIIRRLREKRRFRITSI